MNTSDVENPFVPLNHSTPLKTFCNNLLLDSPSPNRPEFSQSYIILIQHEATQKEKIRTNLPRLALNLQETPTEGFRKR